MRDAKDMNLSLTISADVKYSKISRMISMGSSLNVVIISSEEYIHNWKTIFEKFRILSATSIERVEHRRNDTDSEENIPMDGCWSLLTEHFSRGSNDGPVENTVLWLL